ncbi:hypothetical protein JXA80_04600, partial [bacterium]|nr:hypothetical protein [candidate division CSSED10-310 bacterium]
VIRAPDGHNRGGGIYFLTDPLPDASPHRRHTIIQCPHARSDVYTGKLGLALFQLGGFDAFFSSSMRRNTATQASGTPIPDVEDPMTESSSIEDISPADPAHNRFSFFQIAHETWMRRHPATLVIQLHGFAESNVVDDRQFDLILSGGKPPMDPDMFFLESARRLTVCLPGYRVGLFGKDTPLFGAQSNVQGRYIHRYTAGTFWHLEMNRRFRDALMKNNALRSLFFTCIQEIAATYEM